MQQYNDSHEKIIRMNTDLKITEIAKYLTSCSYFYD